LYNNNNNIDAHDKKSVSLLTLDLPVVQCKGKYKSLQTAKTICALSIQLQAEGGAMEMTPQPSLAPAFPVARLPALPPVPRSSSPACITILRPTIESRPLREMTESTILTVEVLKPFAMMLPKSPTCLKC